VSEAADNESARDPREGPDDGTYFACSATLRIFGNIPDLDEITWHLGVAPSGTHRKGERGWGPSLPPYEHDMWSYNAPVEKAEPLHVHVDARRPKESFRRRSKTLRPGPTTSELCCASDSACAPGCRPRRRT
jgi:uncharacterized protein DUF4279